MYNEDCLQTMSRIPNNFIDLTIMAPPYNLGIAYDNYDDDIPADEYFENIATWLQEIYRITKADGRVCINHCMMCSMKGERFSPIDRIARIAKQVGFKYHGLAIWTDRTVSKLTAWGSWRSASAPYINLPYEGILVLYKDRWKKDKRGTTNISKQEFMQGCSGIWDLKTNNTKYHPAAFPITLPNQCIKLLTYENDIVYDPFIGTGTTAIACKKLNRYYIGSEISKNYCAVAERRLSKLCQ